MTVAALSIARTILCERIPHPPGKAERVWRYVADGLNLALGIRSSCNCVRRTLKSCLKVQFTVPRNIPRPPRGNGALAQRRFRVT